MISWDLSGPRPSNDSFRHLFKVTNNTPVYLPVCKIPKNHNYIMREKIDVMLTEPIMRPATSPWGFPVVIFRKTDRSPRF